MRKIHNYTRQTILRWIDVFYPLFKKWFSLQTFRYAAAGGVNTLLDILLFSISYNFILKKHQVTVGTITISPHVAAMFMALSVSLPTGFYLNRYVVFQYAGLNKRSQLARYILVVTICIFLNYVFLKFFVEILGWYPTPSKIFVTAIVIVISYSIQTFYFFRTKPSN